MTIRKLAWLIAVYVTLDFANPLMPGAVTFDADASIEGVTVDHSHGLSREAVLSSVFVDVGQRERPRVRRSQATTRSRRFVEVRRTPAPSSDPPSPTEDH